MSRPLPTLRSRVALAAGIAGALVGLVAATSSALFVAREQRTNVDRRLLDAARLFAVELESTRDASALAAEENTELEALGMHLGLFEADAFLGGAALPTPSPTCQTLGDQRACTLVTAQARSIVVRGADLTAPTGMLPWAIGLASLLAALGAALTSRALARWALGPLDALRASLDGATFTTTLDLGPTARTEEVEALRTALNQLFARFQEAAERARLFSSGAAHELKNPLATLFAELELAQGTSPADMQLAISRSLRTLRRLSAQVDRLLTLARGEEGVAALTETLALEDVVREAVTHRSAAEQARLTLAVDDAGMVRGDSALLAAIADNLIDNALKYSGELPVQLRVSSVAAQVRLTVTDGGPGIAVERVEALLRPFARGQTTQPGHGLGLAIVHHAVGRHGGNLAIEGSTVIVSLPRWT